MMHPSTELRSVGPEIGFGVFATEEIKKGTIVYVKDCLEVVIREEQYLRLGELARRHVDRYSYQEPAGDRILSSDIAKYVNHSCEANSMSCGWGFELAVRDIAAGEEITDEYGLLNIEAEMACCCSAPSCRRSVSSLDFEQLGEHWDAIVRDALRLSVQVPQPLLEVLPAEDWHDCEGYLRGARRYRSVRELRYFRSALGLAVS